MGEVWKARDPRLGRDVAIKVLPAALSQDPDRLKRFEQEARAAGALNHPAITAVFDIGTHEGSLYVVSELLEGETLRSRLAAGPLPPRKAIDYAAQIARGLAAAHEKGIVHRDLKPENLFVTADGRMKILDFGLVKLTRPERGALATEVPTAAGGTEPGVVLGTLGYMSPEQVRGQEVDSRSDIFSFGAVLYEMLAGRRAFSEDSAADTMIAILTKEPPELAATGGAIPPALERIVAHCLEKNPAERFQSARDLAFDLEALSTLSAPERMPAAPAEEGRRRGAVAILAALAAAAAALAGGFFLGRGTAGSAPPSYLQLSYRRGLISAARFTPDGQTIVYSGAFGGDPLQTFIKRPDSPDAVPIGPPHSNILAISKKGEMALALEVQSNGRTGLFAGTLARAPLTGGTPREMLEHVQQADWTPDGSDLLVVRDAAGSSRLEFPPGKVLYETGGHISYARFSPKGDRIAFFDHPLPGDDRGALAVVDLAGMRRTLSRNYDSVHGLAWSPSGDEIWIAASTSGPALVIRGISLSGKERLIAQGPGPIRLDDVASSGHALVTRESFEVRAMALAPGADRERDLTWLEWSVPQYLSPDGRTLLFTEEAAPTGRNYAACIRKTDGSPPVRLGEGNPFSLSEDGKWVLAKSPAPTEPYVILPTGAGEVRRISFDGFEATFRAAFLPGGREILFGGRRPKEPVRLFRGSLDGGKAVAATPQVGGNFFVVSADGKRVIARGADRVLTVFNLEAGGDAPGRPIPQTVAGDVPIQWSADGRSVFVRRSRSVAEPTAPIFRLDLETGRAEPWKELALADPAGGVIGMSIQMTPDGKSYAYGVPRTLSQLYLVEGLR